MSLGHVRFVKTHAPLLHGVKGQWLFSTPRTRPTRTHPASESESPKQTTLLNLLLRVCLTSSRCLATADESLSRW